MTSNIEMMLEDLTGSLLPAITSLKDRTANQQNTLPVLDTLERMTVTVEVLEKLKENLSRQVEESNLRQGLSFDGSIKRT